LLEYRDRFVTRRELLEHFWDGREGYDEALTKCVGAIRKALDEPHENPRFIETRWAEGYRFIGSVAEQESLVAPPAHDAIAAPAATPPATEFIHAETGAPPNQNQRSALSAPPPAVAVAPPPRNSRRTSLRTALLICAACVVAVGAFVSARVMRPSGAMSPVAPAPLNSLAVMPFKNLSPAANADAEIFADGLTDSLIGSLAKVAGLKVISRGSVFVFKGKEADPREVGRRLGVATVLEGSVREDGDRVRVAVRLVSAADGQVLWSADDYERARGDLFQIQEDIARSVTARLSLQLSPAGEEQLTERRAQNSAAYQAYIKGRYFWKKKTPEGLSKAREFFAEALRLEPTYAPAYAGLADCYLTGIWYANYPPQEAVEKAKPAALKALELDGNLAEAHIVRARIAEMEWDWETSRQSTEKALALDPN
ncbi:MAG: winged helix-turn-helix domain-containing protein, partial [Pseudonocardiaceae bacterium]